MQYWQVTGDDAFMRDHGAELVLDGAVFWASAARLEEDGKYHFRNVIGPDEYHDRIDDNAYTNQLAAWHLRDGTRRCWRGSRSTIPERGRGAVGRAGLIDRASWSAGRT